MPQFEEAKQVVVPHTHRLSYTRLSQAGGIFDIMVQIAPECAPNRAYFQAWLDAVMDSPCRVQMVTPVVVWDIRQRVEESKHGASDGQ